jgi:hypothetical protein
MWLMDFIYEIEQRHFFNCFKSGREGLRGRDYGGDLTNVQYKLNWNCHYECPLYNEHILKIFL